MEYSGFLRFEAFTLFLGLSFAGARLLASCFRSRISQRNSEIILSLSSVRDVMDEYFKPPQTFFLPGSCEPLEVALWSLLLIDLSLGSVCCGGAFAEAPPVASPLEVSYGVSVGQEGLYKVSEETL